MFAILFVWQVPHFLAIAIMYRDDYEAGGFKMLPVADRELKATGRQILLYATASVPVSDPAISGAAGPVYAVAAIVLGIVFLGYAVMCAARRTRGHARKLFFASIIYLPVLLTVMMLDQI